MKTMIRLQLYSLVTLILTLGCGETKSNPPLKGGSLKNTSWILVELPGHDVKSFKIVLNFEDHKLHGKGVCNNYFSDYAISSNKLEFGTVGATRKMCASGTKLEMDYLDLLSMADQFGIAEDTLLLKTPKGFLKFLKRSNPTKQ